MSVEGNKTKEKRGARAPSVVSIDNNVSRVQVKVDQNDFIYHVEESKKDTFVCSQNGYVLTLKIVGAIQFILILCWITVLLILLLYYPATRLTARFLPLKEKGQGLMWAITCVFAMEPLASFALLVVAFVGYKKKTGWIRIFYVANSWMIWAMFALIYLFIYFSAQITPPLVREKMRVELSLYDEVDLEPRIAKYSSTPKNTNPHDNWDQIHRFFKCCGIDSPRDWYENRRQFFSKEEKKTDMRAWTVPPSCCRSSDPLEVKKCAMFDPSKYLINGNFSFLWNKGCLSDVLEMQSVKATSVGLSIFLNLIVQALLIGITVNFHYYLRFDDGSNYQMNTVVYLSEVWLCHIFRSKKKRNKVKIEEKLEDSEKIVILNLAQRKEELGFENNNEKNVQEIDPKEIKPKNL